MSPWQLSNPLAAKPRHGYRPGDFGRLGGSNWFNTIVTNVSPTAKQSWVLHYQVRQSPLHSRDTQLTYWPKDKRVYTVHEFARGQGFPDWFKFITLDGSVKTVSGFLCYSCYLSAYACHCGRTQIQTQISNAVAWPVGEALGRELEKVRTKWLENKRDTAMLID